MSEIPAINFVEPGEAPASVNVCLYGPPGSGKTVAACGAPGPVLVLNAEGEAGLRFARKKFGNAHIREVKLTGADTLEAFTHYLKTDADEQTVVVDSVGEMYDRLLRELGGVQPTLQMYGRVNSLVEDFVRTLRDLPRHVVLICHEQIDDSEEGGATRRPKTGGKKLPEALMAMVDVVAYCTPLPGDEEDDPPRYVGQLVQARGRRAKDRSGALGAWRDLDLSEWIGLINDALQPADLPWDQGHETLKEAV